MDIKPGRKTSEFALTVGTTVLYGAIGLGIIDPQLIEFGTQAMQTVQDVAASGNPLQAATDAVFKLVALVMGGHAVASYSKSRGAAKGQSKENKTEKEEGNG